VRRRKKTEYYVQKGGHPQNPPIFGELQRREAPDATRTQRLEREKLFEAHVKKVKPRPPTKTREGLK